MLAFFQLLLLLQVFFGVLCFFCALAPNLLVSLLVQFILVGCSCSLLCQFLPEPAICIVKRDFYDESKGDVNRALLFQLGFLFLFRQRGDLFRRFGKICMPSLARMELGLGDAPKFSTALVTQERLRFFPRL